MGPSRAICRLSDEDARDLAPLMQAGLRGLRASRWKPGHTAEYLVAPIVLAVVAEVSRMLNLDGIKTVTTITTPWEEVPDA